LKQSKFGRPPLAPGQTRDNRVVTFVTQVELQQLKDLSDEQNASLSSVCHLIISDYLKQKRSAPR